MKKILTLTLLLGSIVVYQLGCTSEPPTVSNSGNNRPTPTPTPAQDAVAQLISASKAAGIEVIEDEVLSVSRGQETFLTAPIASWVRTPATELRTGVNIAFVYVSAKAPNVPPGYYTVRAFADDVRVGKVAGRAQLIDRNGKVAAEIPGQVEIHSLTVPPSARTVFVTTGDGPDGQLRIWHRCDNGQCFLFGVFSIRGGSA